MKALPLAVVVLAAAGCGGRSRAPSVASLGTAAPTTPSPKASFTAFADCVTRHGIRTISPGGRGVEIDGGPDAQVQSACRTLMPGGGPPQLSPARMAERRSALAKLAACMRKHGVTTFPDDLDPDTLQNVDTGSPVFKSAYKACSSLYPKTGLQIGFAS